MAEVLQLRQQLRRERLLITEERRQIEKLSESIGASADKAFQSSWRARQAYRSVDLLSSSQMTAQHCASRISQAESAAFVHTHDPAAADNSSLGAFSLENTSSLGANGSSGNGKTTHPVPGLNLLGELLSLLRTHPDVLARLLVFANSRKMDVRSLVEAIVSGVYGNFLVPSDEQMVLKMMERIIALQLDTAGDPRQLLRGVSDCFTVVFNSFIEGYYQAHVYLSETLGEVIKTLAMDDDRYIEFETSKLAARFSEAKREQLFTVDLKPKSDRVHRFLDSAMAKAARYCSQILRALLDHISSLPQGLLWLLPTIYRNIRARTKETDAQLVIADLFFGHIICPAIASPESYILREAVPISDHARYNLSQVARMVQSACTAAITDQQQKDLSGVLDLVDLNPMKILMSHITTGHNGSIPELQTDSNDILSRSSSFMSEGQVQCIVSAVQKAQLSLAIGGMPARITALIGELHECLAQRGSRTPISRSPATERTDLSRHNTTPAKEFAKAHMKLESRGSGKKISKSDNKTVAGTSDQAQACNDDAPEAQEVLIIPLCEEKPCGHVQLKSLKTVLYQFKDQPLEDRPASKSFFLGNQIATSAEPSNANTTLNTTTGSTRHHSRPILSTPSTASVVPQIPTSNMLFKMKTRPRSRPRAGTGTSLDDPSRILRTPSPLDGRSRSATDPFAVSPLLGNNAAAAAAAAVADIHDSMAVRPGRTDTSCSLVSSESSQRLMTTTGTTPTTTEGVDGASGGAKSGSNTDNNSDTQDADGGGKNSKGVGRGDSAVCRSSQSNQLGTDASLAQDNEVCVRLTTRRTRSCNLSSDMSLHHDQVLGQIATSSAAQLPEKQCDGAAKTLATQADEHSKPGVASDVATAQPVHSSSVSTRDPIQRLSQVKSDNDGRSDDASGSSSGASGGLDSPDRMLQSSSAPASTVTPSPTPVNTTPASQSQNVANNAGIRRISTALSKVRRKRVGRSDTGNNSIQSMSSVDSFPQDAQPTGEDHADKPNGGVVLPPDSSYAIDSRHVSATTSNTSLHASNPPRAYSDTHIASSELSASASNSSKTPFWKSNPLSSLVSGLRKPATQATIQSPDGEVSSSAEIPKDTPQTSATPDNQSQADNSVLDDITAKYQRLAEAEKRSKEAEQSAETDGGACKEDTADELEARESLHNAVFFQAKRQLEGLLAEPPVNGVSQYAANHEDQCLQLRLPISCSNSDAIKVVLLQELDSARYWADDDKTIEASDTLNLISKLKSEDVDKMVTELSQECRQRSFYMAYLLQVKHGLIAASNYLESTAKHISRTQSTVQLLFASSCARSFLEKNSVAIDTFVDEFNALEMPDEKSVAAEDFLSELCSQLDNESVWRGMSDDEWHTGQLAVERYMFGRIHRSAFWPNGETDKLRDRLFGEHIESLQKSITVFHKSLQVAPKYCGQAPWPPAVKIIQELTRYKAPVDKLNVVSECAQCLMMLLSRASRYSKLHEHRNDGLDEAKIEHSVPGADDLFPVLVFVIIQANPPGLLSTVAYIENYHRQRMQGESSYWWAQFQSAVEYIKTLEIDKS